MGCPEAQETGRETGHEHGMKQGMKIETTGRRAEEWIGQELSGLGQRVRAARAQRGMTRKILARDSGVSERYLAQMESGKGNPSVAVLLQIAQSMDLEVTDLFRNTQDGKLGLHQMEARLIHELTGRLDSGQLSEAHHILRERFGAAITGGRGQRIALIGLRGAGKSTLGNILSDQFSVPFVELDREIERAYGADIGELLALAGQPAFRRYEHRCLDHQLAENDGVVIASGGGIVANTEAFNRLLERTHVIWLKATPDEHMDRVMAQGDLRPMANSREAMSDLRGILEAREPLYARAHAIVDTSGAKVAESAAKLTATARALISRDDQASRIATPETLQNRATG